MTWVPHSVVGVGVDGAVSGKEGRGEGGGGVRRVEERDELSCAMLWKWNLEVSGGWLWRVARRVHGASTAAGQDW